MARSGSTSAPPETDEGRRDVEGHQVNRSRRAEPADRAIGSRRVIAEHHLRHEENAAERDHHAEPHAGCEEAFGARQRQQIGALDSNAAPELEGSTKKLEGEHERTDPNGHVHPYALDDIGPIDRAQASGRKIDRGHDEKDERPDFVRNALARSDRDDIAEALSLDLYIKDGEEHRDERHHDPDGLALVEVREQVGRCHVAELLAERPDPGADHVAEGADEDRPRPRVPKPDAVRIEEAARAQKGERGVIGCHDRQIENAKNRLCGHRERSRRDRSLDGGWRRSRARG